MITYKISCNRFLYFELLIILFKVLWTRLWSGSKRIWLFRPPWSSWPSAHSSYSFSKYVCNQEELQVLSCWIITCECISTTSYRDGHVYFKNFLFSGPSFLIFSLALCHRTLLLRPPTSTATDQIPTQPTTTGTSSIDWPWTFDQLAHQRHNSSYNSHEENLPLMFPVIRLAG